jgi:2-haloacid dehalogenase
MTQAVIFDVNETMLDLGALDPLFTEWFDDPAARKEWFAHALHLAMPLAATRAFKSFSDISAAALGEVARRRDISFSDDASTRMRESVLGLPAHPDVEPALRARRDAECITAALSNNPLPVVRERLHHAGLSPLFTEIISVDEVGALKPAPEVYQFAVEQLESSTRVDLDGRRTRLGHCRGYSSRHARRLRRSVRPITRPLRSTGDHRRRSPLPRPSHPRCQIHSAKNKTGAVRTAPVS